MNLLTPEQAAEALSISVRHLLYLTKDGEIPFVNVGRGQRTIRRYDPADIQAFIESRKVTEVPPEATVSVRTSKRQKFEQYAPLDFKALREEIRRKKKEERERLRRELLEQK
ncbi:helix-turn-helix domain-containing protein [Brucella pituitosa]|uniref:helix-turn-helix domain-containing protein n=1 Tax=Brucella pituitosa TaxID=571256 RepID=UPI0020047BDA|nr:helix-turn-helix domain-containing protein [Brucella pituitosa]